MFNLNRVQNFLKVNLALVIFHYTALLIFGTDNQTPTMSPKVL